MPNKIAHNASKPETETPIITDVCFFFGLESYGREERSRGGADPLILKLQPKM